MVRWVVAAFTLLLSCGVTSTQQIFDESFRRMQSYPVPPYAVWTATWHIRARPMGYYTGESNTVEVHRYAVRLADGMENISDPSINGKLPPAIIEPQFLGPFAWRLRALVHVPPPGSAQAPSMQPDVEGLKTIATVVAVATPSYVVDNGAPGVPPVELVDGREAYHLILRPRDDPQKHNLRDLWVDTQTYDLVKAHFIGTYRPVPDAPLSPTDATVSFREVVGCWVVTHAIWTYDDAPMAFTFDLTYNEIGLPTFLPDWLFDDAAYKRHEAAGDPDYLGLLLEQLRKGAQTH